MGEQATSFNSCGFRLAASLELPDGPGPFPGVVLILGSGPQTRDGNADLAKLWHGPDTPKRDLFRHIAHRLSQAGIASLRYDKRGCGDSEGDYFDLDMEGLLADASAAVRFLRTQPPIDPGRVAVLGQSEGAIIAAATAANNPDVAACVLQGAPGRSGKETMSYSARLYRQYASTLSPEARAELIQKAPGSYWFKEHLEEIFERAERGEDKMIMGNGMPVNLRWLKQHFDNPPETFTRRLRCPTLVLAGDHDMDVQPEHARLIEQDVRSGGNDDIEVHMFPNLDHSFHPVAAASGQALAEQISFQSHGRLPSQHYLDTLATWLSHTLSAP